MFPTDLEVEALVASMDEDKSGQIELQELVKHMGLQVAHPDIQNSDFWNPWNHFHLIQIQLRSKLNPEKDFADAFKVFDRDGKSVSKIISVKTNQTSSSSDHLSYLVQWLYQLFWTEEGAHSTRTDATFPSRGESMWNIISLNGERIRLICLLSFFRWKSWSRLLTRTTTTNSTIQSSSISSPSSWSYRINRTTKLELYKILRWLPLQLFI